MVSSAWTGWRRSSASTEGHFAPSAPRLSQQGRGTRRVRPAAVEAAAMVSASLDALRVSGDGPLGQLRALGLRLVPRAESTSACRCTTPQPAGAATACTAERLNENQGQSRLCPSSSPCSSCAAQIRRAAADPYSESCPAGARCLAHPPRHYGPWSKSRACSPKGGWRAGST